MDSQKNIAYRFIVIMGIVSMFGDITYEGARSITGPYMAVLGASAGMVGLITGIGEFVGYALRLVSGRLADRAGAYWTLTFIGYGLIFFIPLLGLTGYWQLAAVFIILERMGKAIRTPARDAILSHATKRVGRGWGFALHEALDQVGAFIGPLIFYSVFILKGGYREGFTLLWIPALLTLVFLTMARIKVPSSENLEISGDMPRHKGKERLPKIFWLYTIFAFFSVAGFAHFQIISYHLKVQSVFSDTYIPVLYATAMAVDAVVALIIGRIYDRVGMTSLILLPILTFPVPFLGFSLNHNFVVISIVLWGAVMGVHETIMRAAIADLTPIEHRGFAYGIFNAVYGASWFLGSAIMGFLYDISLGYLFVFVALMESISVPIFFLIKRENFILVKK